MRLCKDCKYGDVYYSHATGQVENCLHRESEYLDPVHGTQRHRTCREMRRNECAGGTLFEERTYPETPWIDAIVRGIAWMLGKR